MLEISRSGELDFLALGAMVNRLDPGRIPFRKASAVQVHVSGGEFNCAANLSDCFRLKTGIATAMIDSPLGDLIRERVRAMGVRSFYKTYNNDGVRGPNMATVYSDQGAGVRAPVVFYNRANEAAALLEPGDFDWSSITSGGVRWFHSGGIFAALSGNTPEVIIEGMQAAKAAGAVVSGAWRLLSRRCGGSSSTWMCWSATKRTCRWGWDWRVRMSSRAGSSIRVPSWR